MQNKNILIILALIIIVITVPSFLYFKNYFMPIKTIADLKNEVLTYSKDVKMIDINAGEKGRATSLEGQNNGLVYTKENLSKTLEMFLKDFNDQKDKLNFPSYYIKKAYLQQLYFSAYEYENDNERNRVAVETFNTIKNDMEDIRKYEKANNIIYRNVRAKYMQSLNKIFDSAELQSFYMSNFVKDPIFTEIEKGYSKNKEMAALMYIDYYMKQNLFYNDSYLEAIRAYNSAKVAYNFSDVLNNNDLAQYIVSIKTSLNNFENATTSRILDSNVQIAKQKMFIAFAYGVLVSFDPTFPKSKMENAYNDLYKYIETNAKGPQDNLLAMDIYAKISQLSFLYNQNDRVLNEEMNKLILEIVEFDDIFMDNFEQNFIMNKYIGKAGTFEDDMRKVKIDLLNIAKGNRELRAFLDRHAK